jgi:hypothetical protein
MNEPIGYALFDEPRNRFLTDRDHEKAQIWAHPHEARSYRDTLPTNVANRCVLVQVQAQEQS